MLRLDDVTLIGVDGLNYGRLALAFDISAHYCRFGAQKLLTPFDVSDPRAIRIRSLNTRAEYSAFVLRELHEHVDTPWALLVQYDGFVLNPDAWTSEFLEYDYVGAAWRPPMPGGIGGFSLRSKRLLETTSRVAPALVRDNEDVVICRRLGGELERRGLRIAPIDVCRRFAFDATGGVGDTREWNGEFGFHNLANTDLSNWRPPALDGLDANELAATVLELGGLSWRSDTAERTKRRRSWRVVVQERGRVTTRRRMDADRARAFARRWARPHGDLHPILVSSPLALGDALMLSAAIESLRAKHPASPIHVLTGTRASVMFECNPDVDVLIAGPLRERRTIARIEAQYLHVFRTGPWLTTKPDALVENGYELAHRELCLAPGHARPVFHASREELARTRAALQAVGIDPDVDTIALIHPQSSAAMRRWPTEHAATVARALVERGETVVVAGRGLLTDGADVPDGVFFTERHFRSLSTRETFLLTFFASYVVAVDSVFSHLAVCFQKPAVLLYGAFRPELLAAPHCSKAVVLQHDLPCGPCHQHHGGCILVPGKEPAPCMSAIEPAEVLAAVDRLHDSATERWRPRTSRNVAMPHSCAVCEGTVLRPFARKGDVLYGKCAGCDSVTRRSAAPTGRVLSPGSTTWSLDALSTNRRWIVEAVEHLIRIVEAEVPHDRQRRALVLGRERTGLLEQVLGERGWSTETGDGQATCLGTGQSRPGAVIVGGIAMRIARFTTLWEHLHQTLDEGGLVLLLCPVSEYCLVKEAAPFNTPFAAENIVVPSIEGISHCARKAGFEAAYSSRLRTTGWHAFVWRLPACTPTS